MIYLRKPSLGNINNKNYSMLSEIINPSGAAGKTLKACEKDFLQKIEKLTRH